VCTVSADLPFKQPILLFTQSCYCRQSAFPTVYLCALFLLTFPSNNPSSFSRNPVTVDKVRSQLFICVHCFCRPSLQTTHPPFHAILRTLPPKHKWQPHVQARPRSSPPSPASRLPCVCYCCVCVCVCVCVCACVWQVVVWNRTHTRLTPPHRLSRLLDTRCFLLTLLPHLPDVLKAGRSGTCLHNQHRPADFPVSLTRVVSCTLSSLTCQTFFKGRSYWCMFANSTPPHRLSRFLDTRCFLHTLLPHLPDVFLRPILLVHVYITITAPQTFPSP